MKKREFIEKIMSKELVTINKTNSLIDVKEIFEEKKIRHLPVVSGKEIIGLISLTDFMSITYNVGDFKEQVNQGIFSTLTIEQVMTKDLVCVSPKDTIKEVAEIFVEKHFNALPVVNDNELVGIVTSTDIMKYLLEQY